MAPGSRQQLPIPKSTGTVARKPQIQTRRRPRTAAEAGSPLEPQRGDRYLAWGVSPRYQSQEDGKPRRGDRKIQPRVDLSPLRGSKQFSAQNLGLTPQAIHLSRLRRSTRDDTWPREADNNSQFRNRAGRLRGNPKSKPGGGREPQPKPDPRSSPKGATDI